MLVNLGTNASPFSQPGLLLCFQWETISFRCPVWPAGPAALQPRESRLPWKPKWQWDMVVGFDIWRQDTIVESDVCMSGWISNRNSDFPSSFVRLSQFWRTFTSSLSINGTFVHRRGLCFLLLVELWPSVHMCSFLLLPSLCSPCLQLLCWPLLYACACTCVPAQKTNLQHQRALTAPFFCTASLFAELKCICS